MKKIVTTLSLCTLALLLCALCSCSLFGGSKLAFEEVDGGYAVTGRGDDTNTAVEIPEEYKGKPVVAIGDSAFARNAMYDMLQGNDTPQIQTIAIPETVTSIGSLAFSGNTELASITLPAGVTEIGANAFSECTSLTSVTIPDGVTTIKAYTFYGCTSLTSVTIPSSVTKIEAKAFMNCSALTSVELPSSVTAIEESTFEGCTALTEIKLPDGVTSIGDGAFQGCTNMKLAAFPSALTSIGSEAFYGCKALEALTVPTTVTTLGDYAFGGTSETLVVSVSYDKDAPEGWHEDWCAGMAGKAINTSELYYANVVVPNLAKTAEIGASLESCAAQYESYGKQIESKSATLTNMKKNASINPTNSQLQSINNMQKEIQNLRNQQSEVSSKIRDLEKQLAEYKTTNQLN